MRERRRRFPIRRFAALVTVLSLPLAAEVEAATKPRVVLVLPFDTSALPHEHRWLGDAVAELVGLGLSQHPGVVQVNRRRLRGFDQVEAWSEGVVVPAARTTPAEVALFGEITPQSGDFHLQPRVVEVQPAGDVIGLEPLTVSEANVLTRLSALPVTYLRALKIPLSEAELTRLDRATRPTQSVRALELYVRGQTAARRGGQEANETAAELLSRAVEADPDFIVAQYALGLAHQALGNRWKAAAQFRASAQRDLTYPEPHKALGDLFLSAPRRLFDQAVEAYSRALELRPFYADAHVGLGDARAAKGEIDEAIAAYRRALSHNPVNPRVYLSLGRIYYIEKGLYYDAVGAYKRAIELDANSLEARMGLGEIFEEKGLYKEAIAEYHRVIEIDGRHTGAMYNLAIVYEKIDPREAIAQWERYIALASQVPSEKDAVDTARQHLRKLRSQLKE